MILFDQFGRSFDTKAGRKPERNPLPVAPILDSFRQYVTDGLTPERLAAVFKSADSGDMRSQAELFGQLEEKDAHLLCERDKRKNVILDIDFTIEPATESARDLKVAEFIEECFQNISDWGDCQVALQDAVGKGFACLENHWDVSSGQAVIERFEFIEQKRFRFNDNKGLLRKFPLLITDTDAMGEEIPAWRTTMHCYGGKSGHPTRSAIYRVAAWMVLFKNYAIKDWVIFCELFGMPLRIGKYDQGANDDDKKALSTAISSLGSDAAGIISKATEIEFIETVKTAHGDLWKLLADFCDAQISKSVLGQTLTTQVDGKGSYAASKTHNEIRLDLLRADGRSLANTIRSQIIKPLVGYNFGWDTPLPKYQALFDEGANLVEKADWICKLMDRGFPTSVPWLRDEFNVPEPAEGEEIIVVTQQQANPFAAKIVASDKPEEQRTFTAPQQALENLADKSITQDPLHDNEKMLLAVVLESSSYEEAMEKLLASYPDMSVAALEELLENGVMNADLLGRKEVQDGDR